MLLRRALVMIILSMGICANAFASDKIPNIAFLQFVDNTQYSKLNTKDIVSELLLNELVELDGINIVEHGVIQEALEEEKYLNKDSSIMENAAESGDFAALIENQNIVDISYTKPGDFLPLDSVKLIGDKYFADYILHGAINYLGTEEEVNSDLMPIIGLQKIKFSLAATIVVRLVDVQTGQVVWICKSTGVGKSRRYDAGFIHAGASGFNAAMYDEALAVAAQNVAKELEASIKNKKLILRNWSR